jgi:hypothetical protein
MTRQDELVRQGWQRKSTYDEPRLSEMADMYKDIGLEVHLEPFHADEEPTSAWRSIWSLSMPMKSPAAPVAWPQRRNFIKRSIPASPVR